MSFRITYSTLNADMEQVHKEFESGLQKVKLNFGKTYSARIGRELNSSGEIFEKRNPADRKELLGSFHSTPLNKLDEIIANSKKAFEVWRNLHWQERVRLVRGAAELISARKVEFAAIVTLEVGKNRLESLGDVEEAADLLRYYATTTEEANGFFKPLLRLNPKEDTRSVLRPYGVFGVIAPFNFPAALAAGMSGAALLGGNTVILKPSEDTPWSGEFLFEIFRDAGFPENVFQVIQGKGETIGAALTNHSAVDGIAFTGSREVGFQLLRNSTKNFTKPTLVELGGKNAAIISTHADLEKAVEGSVRSAFGLSGQKCSALSRVYVNETIKNEFLERIIERANKIVIGNPADKNVFVGPVINMDSVERYNKSIELGRKEGKVIFESKLANKEEYSFGNFVPPTIVELPHAHQLMRDELFLPFLGVTTFKNFDDAITMTNDSNYGLTAGIYSEDKNELDKFFNKVEAGVLYANRSSGATTGAWPGVQSFCGWKASGASGKGGCGPYYVSQFMREQSQTRMES